MLVLAKHSAERLAERSLACAAITDEDKRDLRLLVRMLHGPRRPIDDVVVERVVACRHHLEDMLAEQRPIAELRLDAPSHPQVESTIDNRCPSRLEDDATVLPPPRVLQPPTTDVDPFRSFFITDVDAPVQIEI